MRSSDKLSTHRRLLAAVGLLLSLCFGTTLALTFLVDGGLLPERIVGGNLEVSTSGLEMLSVNGAYLDDLRPRDHDEIRTHGLSFPPFLMSEDYVVKVDATRKIHAADQSHATPPEPVTLEYRTWRREWGLISRSAFRHRLERDAVAIK